MGSRWTRRSDEDKQRIAKEQAIKPVKKKSDILTGMGDMELWTKIYKEGHAPLYCTTCMSWSWSQHYTLGMRDLIVTGEKFLAIEGHCHTCGIHARRAIQPFTEEGMALLMITAELYIKQRLTDERKG